jgi:hypothetical protein
MISCLSRQTQTFGQKSFDEKMVPDLAAISENEKIHTPSLRFNDYRKGVYQVVFKCAGLGVESLPHTPIAIISRPCKSLKSPYEATISPIIRAMAPACG